MRTILLTFALALSQTITGVVLLAGIGAMLAPERRHTPSAAPDGGVFGRSYGAAVSVRF